jgi:hypothetical protein
MKTARRVTILLADRASLGDMAVRKASTLIAMMIAMGTQLVLP